MNLFRVTVFLICLFKVLTVSGQSKAILVPTHSVDIIESMKLHYNRPKGFTEISESECFESKPKLALMITCAQRQLKSKNGEFIAFFSMYRPLGIEDSIFISRISPNGFPGLDRQHEGNIKYSIVQSMGKEAGENWKQYVDYYPVGEARRKFNADTAIFYSIKLEPKDYYLDKYNHFDVLCLTKKRRGMIFFYCFYTDEGKKKFNEYWKAVEGTLRFLD